MRNIKSENQIHSIRGASLAVRASIISLPPHPIPAVIFRAHKASGKAEIVEYRLCDAVYALHNLMERDGGPG
jgi:hypothetical protein